VLTADQGAAIERIGASLGRFGAFLLHGVTGSGKTEVYLRLIERVLEAGLARWCSCPRSR
jgi:primosomal protein N' (replication factor Y)